MKGHKKQHYIPQCYLEAWCDPDCPTGQTPYVWRFTKDGKSAKKKAPENIFHDNNMYTIKLPDGSRNLVLEHGFSQLETKFSTIRNKQIAKRKQLNADDYTILCAFMAAMWARTKAQREHQRNQWKKPLEMWEHMIEWAKTATPEQKRQAASLSSSSHSKNSLTHEQVKRIVENPLQSLLLPMVEAATPLLYKLNYAILVTDSSPGFITSDNPCVWFDPKAYTRPPLHRAPALIYKTIEITLPVSPHKLIYLNRQGINGYLMANELVIDDLNRRTRFNADEYFVVNSNIKKDIWFAPGIEPEDSWEKVQK